MNCLFIRRDGNIKDESKLGTVFKGRAVVI